MAHPKINIRALQAFVAVYEEQSFSRAAERENATQSGMSTQVKNLELALDAVLLERGKGKFTLTKPGQMIYDEGQRLLHSLYGLEQKVEEMKGSLTGVIRCGMIPSLNRAVLPPTLHAFKADHPHIEVSVLEEYSYSLMRRVVEGDLDFAIVPSGEVLGGLTSSFIGRDTEMLVSQAGRFADLEQLAPLPSHRLNGLNLIVPSTRNIRRHQLETYFDAHGVKLGSLLEIDGMLATLEFVATTDWCAVLPSTLLHPDQSGRVRKLHPLCEPSMTTDYIVVQKTDKALSQGASLLIAHIREETARILKDWPNRGAGQVSQVV
jgi:DNA-binding transcriptional LysR family regulator